jgi:hypothetical protein
VVARRCRLYYPPVNTGFSYFEMSAFFSSFEREFGWSRTGISRAFSLARIEFGLLGPVEGYLTDRVGIGSDFGQVLHMNAIDGMRVFIRAPLGFGVKPDEVKVMLQDNPAKLMWLD